MRELDGRQADLRNWNVFLRAEGDVEDDAPTVNLGAPETQVYQGMNPHEVIVGNETYCANQDSQTRQCLQWSERPVTQTQWEPGPVAVTAGQGSVCFANRGRMGPQTGAVALRLDLSRQMGGTGGGVWGIPGTGAPGDRRTFQWNLTGAAPPQGEDSTTAAVASN
jgi:hypothetical protein